MKALPFKEPIEVAECPRCEYVHEMDDVGPDSDGDGFCANCDSYSPWDDWSLDHHYWWCKVCQKTYRYRSDADYCCRTA